MEDEDVKKIVRVFARRIASASYMHYALVQKLKSKGLLKPDELLTVENEPEMQQFVTDISAKIMEELGEIAGHLFRPNNQKVH